METYIYIRCPDRSEQITVESVYQYDQGRKLCLLNLASNAAPQVHFSIAGMRNSTLVVPQYQNDLGWIVKIPRLFLFQKNNINAYVCVVNEDQTQTLIHVIIPVIERPKPSDLEYTEEELNGLSQILAAANKATQDATNAAFAANNAASHAPYINENTQTWMTWNNSLNVYIDTNIKARGAAGKDIQILGIFDDVAMLQEFGSAQQGNFYQVGTSDPYTMYMWDSLKGWVNQGTISAGGSGDGTVISINRVAPDDEGDITLRISDMLPGADEETNADGYLVSHVVSDNALNLGGKQASEYMLKSEHSSGSNANGTGSFDKFGHVKLSDSVNSASKASSGVAATPYAVQQAYDLANNALPKTSAATNSLRFDGKGPKYYMNPRNLLTNSDFINPINNRGTKSSTTNGEYIIDEWILTYSPKSQRVDVTNNGLAITSIESSGYANIMQTVLLSASMIGKTLTFAVKPLESDILLLPVVYGSSNSITSSDQVLEIIHYDNNGFYIRVHGAASRTIEWAALYEGTYTNEDIPRPVKISERLELLNMGLPLCPVNLLDNSNFLNPINQRGFASGDSISSAYFFDRWRTSGAATITYNANGMTITSGSVFQILPASALKSGKTYTIACKVDGVILAYTGTQGSTFGVWESGLIMSHNSNGDYYYYLTKQGAVYEWAALYEGAYTAETLPPYTPKPYVVELAECQRYYRHIGAETWLYGHIMSGYGFVISIPDACNMRTVPSVIFDTPQIFDNSTGWTDLPSGYGTRNAQGVNIVFANVDERYETGKNYLVKGIHALSANL